MTVGGNVGGTTTAGRLGGRDFALFWAAETLSTFGSSFSLVAVPLLILEATGSVAQMGLLTGAASVASLVAGAFAGGIADRVDRKRLLVVCNGAQELLLGTVPLVWFVSPATWLLYVVVPIATAFAMLFRVGYVTVVPQLVDAERITQANGRLSASGAAAGLFGAGARRRRVGTVRAGHGRRHRRGDVRGRRTGPTSDPPTPDR